MGKGEKKSKKQEKKKKKKLTPLQKLYEYSEILLLALGTVIILFTFVLKFVSVSGNSMLMSFSNRDKVIVSELGYTPKIGDVVVVDVTKNLNDIGRPAAASPFIKRVIATEGQTVLIDPFTWTVYVDGVALDEPYVYRCDDLPMMRGDISYPYTVPEGSVFVMGDNRNASTDSRKFGAIDEKYILGKVYLRFAPKFGVVK